MLRLTMKNPNIDLITVFSSTANMMISLRKTTRLYCCFYHSRLPVIWFRLQLWTLVDSSIKQISGKINTKWMICLWSERQCVKFFLLNQKKLTTGTSGHRSTRLLIGNWQVEGKNEKSSPFFAIRTQIKLLNQIKNHIIIRRDWQAIACSSISTRGDDSTSGKQSRHPRERSKVIVWSMSKHRRTQINL